MIEQKQASTYEAVVIGASAGGIEALIEFFSQLRLPLNLALIVCQHQGAGQHDLCSIFQRHCPVPVISPRDKTPIRPGHIYLASSDYHLLVEPDRVFSVSVDPHVNCSRPSIDILFESAADVFGPKLIGVLLTGANSDGTKGLKRIQRCRGFTIVQDPEGATVPFMPQNAINHLTVDRIDSLSNIVMLLNEFSHAGAPVTKE